MSEGQVKIAPPWEEFARKLERLFKGDGEVSVQSSFDGGARRIKVLVSNAAKAEALSRLLPSEIAFGNVKVALSVVPANDRANPADVMRTAFSGNPNFAGIVETHGIFGDVKTYATFRAEVAQYWNDNLGNPSGVSSELLENIAKECLTGEAGRAVIMTTEVL